VLGRMGLKRAREGRVLGLWLGTEVGCQVDVFLMG
jgi:hypothetical protein